MGRIPTFYILSVIFLSYVASIQAATCTVHTIVSVVECNTGGGGSPQPPTPAGGKGLLEAIPVDPCVEFTYLKIAGGGQRYEYTGSNIPFTITVTLVSTTGKISVGRVSCDNGAGVKCYRYLLENSPLVTHIDLKEVTDPRGFFDIHGTGILKFIIDNGQCGKGRH